MSLVAGAMTKRKLDEVEGFEQDGRFTRSGRQSRPASTDQTIQQNYMGRSNATSHGTDARQQHSGQVPAPNEPQAFSAPPSEPTSSRPSSTSSDNSFRAFRLFEPNASIVLVGMRGTGKSSLAVILATATGRRLIHADQYFEQVTGLSRAALKAEHGISEYRKQEAKVMESMLVENRKECVIDCGPGSMEPSGQNLLRDYARTHPVIHILRDAGSIQAYIKAWNTEKVHRFLTLSGPLYRACSNLEFFNVSESGFASREPDLQLGSKVDELSITSTPFLTLKRVERDFLQFVAHSVGNITKLAKPLDSFPLSRVPIESRIFTYAICVPLSAMSERDLDIEDLESTADAFELQIDAAESGHDKRGEEDGFVDRISQTLATIRRSVIVPLIYHVDPYRCSPASTTDVAEFSRRSDDTYLNLVEHGLRLCPEFLTVDLSYGDSVFSQITASKGQTRIIGHFSSLHRSPTGWDDPQYMAMYERAMKLGCDLVRISQPAVTLGDNYAVQRLQHKVQSLSEPHPPLIVYNTGPIGRLSCCFNQILTPVTHPSLISDSRGTHSHLRSHITVREGRKALFASFALDPMRFYVFGAHVTYSLSPAMHNAAYEACGMPHVYGFHQSPSLRGLNELVEDPHFGGSSLGLPYKTEVIPLLDSMSPHARAIGAINTILPIRSVPADGNTAFDVFYHDRSRAGPVKALYGDNTDWIGIRSCIRRGLSPANAVRPSSTGLVIGAGGMARAAVYSVIQMGVQNIFIYNRTVANAQKLAHHYNRQDPNGNNMNSRVGKATVHVIESLSDPWPENYKQPTIVVSCIPQHSISGYPAPNFELPMQWIESPTGGVVIELAYKPLDTSLVKQMRALSDRGWVALDGLDVLPEQGFAQFELFTGRRSPRRLMRAIVRKEYKGEEGQYDPHAN